MMASEKLFLRLFEVLEGQFLALKTSGSFN